MLDYVSRNYEFRCGLRMINVEWDHYPWLLAVSWWLTVAESNAGNFDSVWASTFAGWAPSATTRRCASSARINRLRNIGAVYDDLVPCSTTRPVHVCGCANLQPEWIPSRYWIVSAITIQIVPASKADWIRLEEAADVWGVKAVAQIIQANVLIPLLAGEEMAHVSGGGG
jgi:hypothetical protein